MSILKRIKQLLAKILYGNKLDTEKLPTPDLRNKDLPKPSSVIEFPKDELISSITQGVLDTQSEKVIDIFKHNLEVLIRRTKEAGKVEKFIIIREDDFFPEGWQWGVLSSTTHLESVCTPLSQKLKEAYALRVAGLSQDIIKNNIRIPQTTTEQKREAVKKIDRTIGNFFLPARFRSTKHFTINTPLEVTGDYNSVRPDRDYIILDSIDEFLKSGYGYSVSYHDAYLDITHESLPISEKAIVLINEEKYDRIMSDPKKAAELTKRKVIKYRGDTYMAINIVLSEIGALPSQIGSKYALYDTTITSIIDKSIKKLAKENKLLFDRSHGGSGADGHFTSYFDTKNHDFQDAEKKAIEFLITKFPDKEQLFRKYLSDKNVAQEIIEQIGIDDLLSSINEYNKTANEQLRQSIEIYTQERKSITPTMHNQFTYMVRLLNRFYTKIPFDSDFDGKAELENSIQQFFQGQTYPEQMEGLKAACKKLRPYFIEMQSNQISESSTELQDMQL